MPKIKDITDYLEKFAPLDLQESYDNCGLLVGDPNSIITKILLTLDCTEEVINEAIELGCELVIAHHPIIFKGLKSLTGKNYIENTVIKAIKNDIAIYACHTNLDHIKQGVNHKIAQKLQLINCKILVPKNEILYKLETYCPSSDTEKLLAAFKEAGAGTLGNYFGCSFTHSGIGRFTGNESSNPTLGTKLKQEEVHEDKIEVLLPGHLKNKILSVLKENHSYEEPAFFLQALENANPDIGSGMIGELINETDIYAFFDQIKKTFNAHVIKHTSILKPRVKKIALCGGSGSFLIQKAILADADVFLSADFKYHEFFDTENKVVIADIGHYETESCTKELFFDILNEKFANIALVFSKSHTNPVKYY